MDYKFNEKQVKSVSEITRELQELVESKFRFVRVAGEISNYRRPMSGHHYFNLKDQNSQIKVVLFNSQGCYLA